MNETLISVITATHNDADYLKECIDSMLAQSYTNWEWIIVNNGSTDGTADILSKLKDDRVETLSVVKNVGVSAGRNLGIERCSGKYICFFDGDDILPPKSLESRWQCFQKDEDVEFVDGKVISFKGSLSNVIETYTPNFTGNPLQPLLSIDGSVFKGNTWMIKRLPHKQYAFKEHLTHGEELFFYVELASTGKFAFTHEPVLYYRRRSSSAMSNLEGLEKGYLNILNELKMLPHVNSELIDLYRNKAKSIVSKSYLKRSQFIKALRSRIKFNRL